MSGPAPILRLRYQHTGTALHVIGGRWRSRYVHMVRYRMFVYKRSRQLKRSTKLQYPAISTLWVSHSRLYVHVSDHDVHTYNGISFSSQLQAGLEHATTSQSRMDSPS